MSSFWRFWIRLLLVQFAVALSFACVWQASQDNLLYAALDAAGFLILWLLAFANFWNRKEDRHGKRSHQAGSTNGTGA